MMLKSFKWRCFGAFHFTSSKMAGKKKEELKLATEQTERFIVFYQEEVDLWNFSSTNWSMSKESVGEHT